MKKKIWYNEQAMVVHQINGNSMLVKTTDENGKSVMKNVSAKNPIWIELGVKIAMLVVNWVIKKRAPGYIRLTHDTGVTTYNFYVRYSGDIGSWEAGYISLSGEYLMQMFGKNENKARTALYNQVKAKGLA